MIAGVVSTTALTGCAGESVDEMFLGDPHVKDGYIIIEQNDKDVLHKGKFYRTQGSAHGYQFDCGEDFYSTADSSAYFKHPNSERYDEKCKECFGLDQ